MSIQNKKSVLEVKNISKQYKSRKVLKSVSLELCSSEVVGLFGSNGSGKTTCFNIIIGFIRQDRGSIKIGKRSLSKISIYERAKYGISYLPQESCVFPGLSVEDNLKMILQIIHKNPKTVDQKATELLQEFSIAHLKSQDAALLSGGERRRLELARCLATSPKFVLLDEPLAAVDPIAIKDIISLIAHLKERGVGVLVTDHNMRDMLSIIDRAYIIHDGEIISSGDSAHIVADENVKRFYLGEHYVK